MPDTPSDPSRRRFFRTFSQDAVQAAVQVVGPSAQQTPDQPVLNAAAAQYGNKVLVCAVTPKRRPAFRCSSRA